MNSHSSLLRIFSRETKRYRQNVTFQKCIVFLKTDFFVSENTLDLTVLICTYQECSLVVRRLSWEMVLMHVIPKPECLSKFINLKPRIKQFLNQTKEQDLALVCCSVFL